MATFFNQAILSYNNNVTNSNIVTGELLEVLSATKTAVSESYSSGDAVTYIVSIVNSGSVAYTSLTLTDDLGAYSFGEGELTPLDYEEGSVRYYINGELQAAPEITAGPPLVITGISVPANGNAIIVYSARVNSFAPLTPEATIVNTATINGGGISTEIIAEEEIASESEPRLSITKSISPTSVVENGEITYTFVIQNLGNTAADVGDNVILTDIFDPILDISSVVFNGVAWSSPEQYTYDETTGLFTSVSGAITVPAAEFTQNEETGVWSVTPGVVVLTVAGTV